jgi:DNA-binding NarL/FixJ family response regulator
MRLRVMLADDHQLFRSGLRTLLEKQPSVDVVGEARDGPEAVSLALELRPDIVLMDISMPKLNGIDATRRLCDERSQIRVIVLSMHSDQKFVIESLRAGAAGYLLKDCGIDEVMEALRTVAEGRIYLAPVITGAVLRDYVQRIGRREGSVFGTLSAREREVLQLLAEGKSTKEIAAQLKVSIKTIETHRKQIMDKLDIHSIAELTKYAIREGLTPLE